MSVLSQSNEFAQSDDNQYDDNMSRRDVGRCSVLQVPIEEGAELLEEGAELVELSELVEPFPLLMVEAHSLLQAVVDGTTDAIFLKDLQGRYQMVNAAGARFIGKTVAEVLGRDDTQLFPPHVAAQTQAKDRQVLASGSSYTYEDTETIEGVSRTFLSTKDVCRDERGRTIGIIGIARDITDRKSSDDRLRLLAAALENANDVVLITEAEPVGLPGPRVIYVNDAFTRMTGYSPEEILGRTPRILQGPGTDPQTCALLRRKLKAWKPVQVELLNYRKDGTPFWSQLDIRPLADENGWYTHWISIQRDVTERRRAEEAERAAALGREGELTHDLDEKEARFRSVVEGLGEGILITDLSDGVLYANPRLAEMTGWEQAEMLGRPAYEMLLAPEDWPDLHAGNSRRAEGFSDCWEAPLQRKDGTRFWAENKATPFRDAAGCVVGTLGAITDISGRKELEAERERQLAEALERADRDPLTGLLNHRAFHRQLEIETDRAQREGTTLAVAMLDLDSFGFFNNAYGHIVGDQVLRLVAERLQRIVRSYDSLARFGGDEFALLLAGTGTATASEVEGRLRADLAGLTFRPAGSAVDIPLGLSVGVALFPRDGSDRYETLRLADERLLRAKSGASGETEADRVRSRMGRTLAGFSMLDALVTAVDNKDRYTCRHSEDVLTYSLQIARGLGLDETIQETVAVAALLHDVGKIGVPDAVLRKPSKLTEVEFEAIRQHPQMGAAIVGAVSGLEATLDAVRYHHERWDGGGYPSGLVGEATPLLARLMAVADAFSAMTTDRPYRKGMVEAWALHLLEEGAGTQWDPRCVQAFLTSMAPRTQKLPTQELPFSRIVFSRIVFSRIVFSRVAPCSYPMSPPLPVLMPGSAIDFHW